MPNAAGSDISAFMACEEHGASAMSAQAPATQFFQTGRQTNGMSVHQPHLGGEDLAQLHAPLVKAVDAPHKALRGENSKRSDALTLPRKQGGLQATHADTV